jgi:hypothetical protein
MFPGFEMRVRLRHGVAREDVINHRFHFTGTNGVIHSLQHGDAANMEPLNGQILCHDRSEVDPVLETCESADQADLTADTRGRQ